MNSMEQFIAEMPKVELHMHIEGTVTPSKILELAERNGIDIPYKSEDELLAAQDYGQPALDNFLDYHYMCTDVLCKAQDVYEITRDYLRRCKEENILHVELSFDPQVHIKRGMGFDDLIDALNKARRESDVSTQLIMCMNRDRSQGSALEMLDLASKHRNDIVGVGLDSYEEGNPPIKFKEFFARAQKEGYRLTAHCDCDQNNAVEHARQCIHDLGLERIDHGLHILDDVELIRDARARNITLTMCPTWRPSDQEPRRLSGLRRMLDENLRVCVNTDDPEEFASRYMVNMMIEVQRTGGFSAEEMTKFMQNAFEGSWIDEELKTRYLLELDTHLKTFLNSSEK